MKGVATGHSHSPLTATSPKEYTISTPTGDVVIDQDLCSIMLKPASATRGGKGKTRWHQLDPGNQCIRTGTLREHVEAPLCVTATVVIETGAVEQEVGLLGTSLPKSNFSGLNG